MVLHGNDGTLGPSHFLAVAQRTAVVGYACVGRMVGLPGAPIPAPEAPQVPEAQ